MYNHSHSHAMKTIFYIYSETYTQKLSTKVQKMTVIFNITVPLFGLTKDFAY
jgi:hypothetical protein